MNEKSQRVKNHFAETAKTMIIKEGVESVSVRKVANQAGYSYATIYNHFKNLDQLLWHTRNLMILDIFTYMKEKNASLVEDITGIEQVFRSYLDYFMQNPNVYRFFYFHHLSKADKPAQTDQIPSNHQYLETFEFLTQSGKYSTDEVLLIVKTLIYASQGLLTMLLSDNDDLKPETAYQEIDTIIDFMLKEIK